MKFVMNAFVLAETILNVYQKSVQNVRSFKHLNLVIHVSVFAKNVILEKNFANHLTFVSKKNSGVMELTIVQMMKQTVTLQFNCQLIKDTLSVENCVQGQIVVQGRKQLKQKWKHWMDVPITNV